MLLKVGAIYEHVKTGKKYILVALAKESFTLEERVVYEALYDNSVSKVWTRSKESFLGKAISSDGTTHPRFRLVE